MLKERVGWSHLEGKYVATLESLANAKGLWPKHQNNSSNHGLVTFLAIPSRKCNLLYFPISLLANATFRLL